jgi:valyl-tRNA synthetase
MDMRPQSHEIIRTWAFYTIVKAYLHEGEDPLEERGDQRLDPGSGPQEDVARARATSSPRSRSSRRIGADAVRYWAARARLGVDTAYDEQAFKVGRKLVTKLFNASKFAIGRFAGSTPRC